MTENLPDEELNPVGDGVETDALDPVSDGQPDSYPQAAETNPDQWRQDPLLQDEPGAGSEPDPESDQAVRDRSEEDRYNDGEEQIPPDEPTMGEAASDVDFGDPMDDTEADASDDEANFGGSPLSQFEPDDLDR
ncbi:hypothetical protein [Arthrobacter sp. H5]|uniref:hypothetical protein n=1 Tax=Arthrobacter sp. H5 TaxID=1267973 RepID=UPI0004806E9C|nr:hypothetical protein [Arthrobacter sp. H5]